MCCVQSQFGHGPPAQNHGFGPGNNAQRQTIQPQRSFQPLYKPSPRQSVWPIPFATFKTQYKYDPVSGYWFHQQSGFYYVERTDLYYDRSKNAYFRVRLEPSGVAKIIPYVLPMPANPIVTHTRQLHAPMVAPPSAPTPSSVPTPPVATLPSTPAPAPPASAPAPQDASPASSTGWGWTSKPKPKAAEGVMTFKMTNRKIASKKSALEKAFGQDDDADEAVAAEVKKQMERAGRQTRWTIGRQVCAWKLKTCTQYIHTQTHMRIHVHGGHTQTEVTHQIRQRKHN